ncbi:hypothetical protein MSG28_000284 [Choristoneura fumiferana]|uniref:Uncharacterized protein n=1 Tax=Choristoneura fumiferana TaxID=7141 RepID=A0ACC0K0J8_CHOFU|nr:hypothetical protein MSG28_000284 [Choristoneura fumiferana]
MSAFNVYVFFMAAALVFSSAPLPLMLLRPFSPKNALLPAALLRYSARLLGMRFTVRGLENVDNSRGTVVLLNHQSCLDLFVLAVLWPLMARCTVISKRTMQYMVPFGTAAWMWGTVFIDRGSRSAHDALKKQARAVKEEKRKLLLFPEGTRHCGDKLLPFRKGAFHVAMDAGAAIQPVVASKYHFLDSERHRFGSGEIIVTILPMVETAGMTKEDLDVLIEKTYSNMQETFTRTSQETRRVVPRLDNFVAVRCDSSSTNTPSNKYTYAELYRDHLYTKLSEKGKELFFALNIHPSCKEKKGDCISRRECIAKKMLYISRVCYIHDLVCCYQTDEQNIYFPEGRDKKTQNVINKFVTSNENM